MSWALIFPVQNSQTRSPPWAQAPLAPWGDLCMCDILPTWGVWLFATPWTVARQAPLSTGFSGQEYRSGLPFPTPRDLPDPEIEPMSLMSLALADGFFTTSATWEAPREYNGRPHEL